MRSPCHPPVHAPCPCCRGHSHVRREATHQALTGPLQESRRGRTAGLQHVTDGPRQLRPRPHPDPRPRREESGPHDQCLESIRE